MMFSVRLAVGTENAGMVLYHDKPTNSWMGLCDLGFKDARLVCMELGHDTGTLLPPGAYGKSYWPLGRPSINCTGEESGVLDCPYDQQAICAQTQTHYVSVSCHDDVIEMG